MHCYSCDCEGTTRPAVAICQRCGGAMCRKHARELRYPPSAVTVMGGGVNRPRIELICLTCVHAASVSHLRSSAPTRARHAGAAVADLPDAQVAVRLVEAFLRGDESAPISYGRASQSRWGALRHRIARLFAIPDRYEPHR